MKKTLLITTDYPPILGGISEYWKYLASYLRKDKFFILTPKFPLTSDRIMDDWHVNAKNIIRTNFYYRIIWPHWLKLFFYLYKLQKSNKYQRIIAGQVLPIGTVLYFFKKFRIINSYFVSCHGMDLEIPIDRKKTLVKKILMNADKLIVNSRYTKRLAQNYGVLEDNIIVISPCPQKLSISQLDIKQKHGIKTTNIMITVCRLVPRKGVDTIIKLLPEVWKKFPDLVYIIVGSGPDKERLDNLVEMHIDKKYRKQIIFTGAVPTDELSAYYQAAKLFIMTARNIKGDVEGFGIVYLEAGLKGLPVIAGDSGGVAEAVKGNRTGFLVRPDKSPEIVHAIKKLISNEELRNKMGQANYEWASSFSWKNEAEKFKNNLLI